MKEQDIQQKLANLSPEKRELLLRELRKRKKLAQPNPTIDHIKPLKRDNALLALSFSQQRLWFLDQLEGQNPTYNMPAVLELSGQLNFAALEKSLNQIVQRHEVLRTEFVTVEGKGYQRVLPELDVCIETICLVDEPDLGQKKQQLIQNIVNQHFDLASAPLFRCQLIQESEQRWSFVICMHHIISDGWSSSILISELSSFYRSNVDGKPLLTPALEIQYADYAAWQRNKLSGDYLDKQLAFWRTELEGLEALAFPCDYPRPKVLSNKGQRKFFTIPSALGVGVEELSRTLNCTPFNTFLALYNVLIYRYTGQADFAVGTPVANRTQSSIEVLIGFFINSLTLRSKIDPQQSFQSLVQQIQKTSRQAIDHQDVPFEKLLDELAVERNMAQSPLFQLMFVFQNTPKAAFDLPDLHASFSQVESSTAKFDLTLTINHGDDGFEGEWEYNTDLFRPETIDQLIAHYLNLAEELIAAPKTLISQARLLSPKEQDNILSTWNAPIDSLVSGERNCIHRVVEKNAQQHADQTAIVYEQESLNYRQLNQQSNQLAHFLVAKGVQQGDFVGLSLDRGLDMMVAILAVLKAGAAYVPLDPTSPHDRIQFIVEDAGIQWMLVDTAARCDEYSAINAYALQSECESVEQCSQSNLDLAIEPTDIAYIIYTSGTTGRPKGVLIAHQNVIRLFDASDAWFEFNEQDVWTLFHSYAFDFSVWEIWGALFHGGQLVIVPQWVARSPEDFYQLLIDKKVTVLNQTPSAFSQLVRVDQTQDYNQDLSLRTIIFGGEALDYNSLRLWADRYGLDAPSLINMYGITETTVHVTYHVVSEADLLSGTSNVGRPIPDLNVYILDAHKNPVPVGVTGEMYVGGAGVAQGYLNRDELNKQKFIQLNLPGIVEQRVYRSGDLARYLPGGEIEYIGRIDSQVKIRGFRIELGEIENSLNELACIKESVVRVEENDHAQKNLVAYIIPNTVDETAPGIDTGVASTEIENDSDNFDIAQVRQALKDRLADYMVPSFFVTVPTFPLTANGKVDHKALHAQRLVSGVQSSVIKKDYVAPKSENEIKLAEIWQAVLNIESVGVNDNFFELGGDSILTIQIVSRAKRSGINITAKQIFENQTISELSRVTQQVRHIIAEQGPVTGNITLSPIQHWFFEQHLAQPNYWHQSVLVEVDQAVDGAILEKACAALIEQHDGLNLGFNPDVKAQGVTGAHCTVNDTAPFTRHSISSDSELVTLTEQIQQQCDITRGAMVLFALIEKTIVGKNQQRWLYVAAHHLVVDGVSWRILLDDLNESLNQLETNVPIQLGKKTTSFQQYSEILKREVDAGLFDDQRGYWQGISEAPEFVVPIDTPTGSNDFKDLSTHEVAFDRDVTEALLRNANQAYGTDTEELLLACLTRALSRWADTTSVSINLEHHGRELPIDEIDLTRTVGWFTAIYPQCFTNHDLSWRQQILGHKETLRAIPDHGLGFGALKYWAADFESADENNVSENADAPVLFNYLGQFSALQQDSALFRLSDQTVASNFAANNQRRYELEVNGAVTEDALRFTINYSQSRINKSSIESLGHEFYKAITECVAHCAESKNFGYSPSDFPLANFSNDELDACLAPVLSGHTDRAIEAIYPLTAMQKGMLFHSLYESKTGLYHEQIVIPLIGDLNGEQLKQAWQATVNQHGILRTSFLWQDQDEPLQMVFKQRPVDFSIVTLDQALSDEVVQRYKTMDVESEFDLASKALLRCTLLQFEGQQSQLIISFHHIILDGWSLGLVLSGAFTHYMALSQGGSIQLPRGPSYERFIAYAESIDKAKDELFWQQYLCNFEQATEIPSDLINPTKTEQRDYLRACVDDGLINQLKSFAQQQGLTPNVLYQAAWSLVLSRLSGQKQVSYGVTVSGRPADIDQIEHTAGMFINTLPMFVEVGDQDLLTWLQALQLTQLDLIKHELSPLADIQRYCNLKQQSLFECLFVFENFPVNDALKDGLPGIEVGQSKAYWHTNFPMTVVVIPGQSLELGVSFDPGLYSEQYIEALLSAYQVTLQKIVGSQNTSQKLRLDQLQFINDRDLQTIIGDWNDTAQPYTRDKTVSQWFESTVERYPENIALSFQGQQMHYLQLNQKANQFARYLLERGVCQGDTVAFCLDRSMELLISILAVWKMGAVYVPLIASYPEERLQFMVDDANAKALVVSDDYVSQFEFLSVERIKVDATIDHFSTDNLATPNLNPEHAAHVLYTSGSTGKPKGIAVPHRSIAGLVLDSAVLKADQDTVFLFNAPISFDATTMELWAPLLNGGRLAIAPSNQVEQGQLLELLKAERVTSLFLTTALFNYQAEFSIESFSTLKTLLVGGDVLSMGLSKKVAAAYPDLRLINIYGPTENCCYTTTFNLSDLDPLSRSIPIGKASESTQLYVLDEWMNPVPKGTPGQLCAAGEGVALEYVNRPELTEQVFVQNPFAEAYGHGPVLYKTGDLVRYLDEGNLEFIGRIDQQVKIRGFRIELPEIENHLDQHDAIRQSAVIAHADGNGIKRLVAYLVMDQSQAVVEHDAIRLYMLDNVPDYMVPAIFIDLDVLPITANGKLDRRALPEPNFERKVSAESQPRNDVESALCEIWSEVLRTDQVGIYDNYFDLGGDSILSIQVLSRAKRAGILITAKQIFELQTVAKLAQVAKLGEQVIAEQGLVEEACLITPIQQWYFDLPLEQPNRWNMSLLLKINSPVAACELTRCLIDTAHAVVEQHDYLRSNYQRIEGQWQHAYAPLDYFTDANNKVVESLDYSASEHSVERILDDVGERAQSSFDLQSGSLFKMILVQLPKNEFRLFWVVHHLVIDGVSWRILLEDLQIGLSQSLAHKAINLGEKSTSFSQWTQAQAEFANSDAVHQQLEYWNNLDAKNVARLPLKETRAHRISEGEEFTLELTELQTQQLLQQANKAYKTEINDLLLTALASALTQQCEHSNCLLHLEGHGREWVSDTVDVSRTVGWFTSLYPVLLAMPEAVNKTSSVLAENEIASEIKAVKQQLRQIPDKGFGYGLIKHYQQSDDEHASVIDFSALENSQVSFNYLGQTDNSFGEQELLLLAPESPGAERDLNEVQPYALDVFGIVTDGRMRFGFRYGREHLDAEFVEALANQFEARLLAILEHCLDTANFGFVPADFDSVPLSQLQIDGFCNRYPALNDIYGLSPLQHGMMFHALLDPDSAVYFEQHCFDINGSLDADKLLSAWQQVVQRHDILRSQFLPESNDHGAMQLVLNEVTLPFSQVNLTELESQQYLLEDRQKGFQFDQAPLMRVALIDHGNGRQKLVWSFHHILLDGWSVSLVVGEVFQLYEFSVRNESVVLPEPSRYKNYIDWLVHQPHQQASDYWQENLAGFTHPTALGMKSTHRLNELESVDNPIYDLELDARLHTKLDVFSKRNRVTLNTIFQSAWALLLGHYSNENDVLFGTTVSGRPADIADVEQMVGLFINTLPLRMTLDNSVSIVSWLQANQDRQLQSRQFEFMPLFEINRLSEVEGDQRLFDSLLVFENYPVSEALEGGPSSVDVTAVESVEKTNFPLTIIVMPGETITVRFSFDDAWFNHTIMARLGRQLSHVIEQLIGDAENIDELRFLDAQDQRQVLQQWNTQPLNHQYPGESVTDAIIRKACSQPNQIAVKDQDKQISYGQLLQSANVLAETLRSLGVQREDLVAVCLNRQAAMVPVLLAVQFAGGAYVPIDSASPVQRIEAMLDDARPKVCVIERCLQDTVGPLLDSLGIHTLVLETVIEDLWTEEAFDKATSMDCESWDATTFQAVNSMPAGNDLAYVIYTSGSTGKPKGVLIEHQGLKNLSEWTAQAFKLNSDSVCTQMAGFGFDACVWEIWPCLMAGATLRVVSDEQRLDLNALASLMTQEQVSHSFMPTPLAEGFIKLALSESSLQVLLTGGDQLTQWPSASLPFTVYNQYGPTEASVVATSAKLSSDSPTTGLQGLPSIGSAIANTELYVLDEALQPVGVGVAGELHIGGVGLARGYLNQPELTQQQFIQWTHLQDRAVRLYKSGDLVRFNDQGDLEFLGRIDQQVKVRGFRIELGEIEAQIALVAGVEECVVQAWDSEQGSKYLAAYIVTDSNGDFDALVDAIRVQLHAKLPSYMMPGAFACLEALPLTENGKVNRKALIQVSQSDQLVNDYVAARNDVEQQLVDIWQQVLELDQVGVHDDFFALGGHSILATKAHARMREQMAIELPLKVLFEVTRIAELAELINSVNHSVDDDETDLDDEDFEEGTL